MDLVVRRNPLDCMYPKPQSITDVDFSDGRFYVGFIGVVPREDPQEAETHRAFMELTPTDSAPGYEPKPLRPVTYDELIALQDNLTGLNYQQVTMAIRALELMVPSLRGCVSGPTRPYAADGGNGAYQPQDRVTPEGSRFVYT